MRIYSAAFTPSRACRRVRTPDECTCSGTTVELQLRFKGVYDHERTNDIGAKTATHSANIPAAAPMQTIQAIVFEPRLLDRPRRQHRGHLLYKVRLLRRPISLDDHLRLYTETIANATSLYAARVPWPGVAPSACGTLPASDMRAANFSEVSTWHNIRFPRRLDDLAKGVSHLKPIYINARSRERRFAAATTYLGSDPTVLLLVPSVI